MQDLAKKELTKQFELLNERDELFLVSISDILNKVKIGMTDIQIQNFVLNNVEFPTDFSKFKQAKLELWARFENIVNMHFDYRKTQAEIELLKAEREALEKKGDSIAKARIKLKEIEVERKQFQLKVIEKTALEKIEEAKSFYKTYEKHKHFDDGVKKEDIEKLERDYWRARTLMNPFIFEERYGIEWIKSIMTAQEFKEYQEVKRKMMNPG